MDCEESKLSLYKTSSVDQCAIGDTITYKIEVTNISCTLVTDAIVKDLLPASLKFVKGSVRINSKSRPNENIISGICIENINIEENYIIDFKAEIIDHLGGQISNEAMVEYKYFESEKYFYNFCLSNCSTILIKNPSVVIEKTIDKEQVNLGDELSCTITVRNNGDLDVFNIHLIDNISPSLEMVEGSFSINDIVLNSIELDKDILLGYLVIGEVKVIKYRSRVISGGSSGKITSNTSAIYNYQLPNKLSYCKKSNTYDLEIHVSIFNFKQLSVSEYLKIPNKNSDIYEVNEVKVDVNIDSTHVIRTCKGQSSEGHILSGYKLIVHGTINQVVEYIACEATKTVHCFEHQSRFSTFVVLPNDFREGSKVIAEPIIENVYCSISNSRCIFESIALLMLAKVKS